MPRIRVHSADHIRNERWQRMQAVYRESAAATMPHRTPDEIDAFVDWDDPQYFRDWHRDPNLLVGTRQHEDMLFRNPHVAIATDAHEIVGYAFSADTTSADTPEMRERLMKGELAKYLWLGEIAVRPPYHRENLIVQLAHATLLRASLLRPVSTTILPGEIRFALSLSQQLGFENTSGDGDLVQRFGEGSEPVAQLRMRAPTVQAVLNRLATPRR